MACAHTTLEQIRSTINFHHPDVLVVAGDIRDNVINVLHKTLDTIKTTVTRKTQFYIE